jgi:hypothetical protein
LRIFRQTSECQGFLPGQPESARSGQVVRFFHSSIRIILQYAIKANAAAVILAHNHPSGNLNASDADVRITERVREALKLVEIQLLSNIHRILLTNTDLATELHGSILRLPIT